MNTRELEDLCTVAASFYERGYAFGSTGNLSLRLGDQIWITPTGCSLKDLSPDRLASIDLDGKPRNENRASKEYPFHLAAYRAAGKRASAVVHLHSTYTVAMSCLEKLDAAEPIRAFTPYYLMRVAPLAVLPYLRPGSEDLASAVGTAAARHDCLLLRNHGSICLGTTLSEAVDRIEELEETSKLYFILRGHPVRHLTSEEHAEIESVFKSK